MTLATILLASCSSDNPAKPLTYSISGRVIMTGTLRNAVGDSLGVQRVDDADSVRVYLYQGLSLEDSTRTIAGGYTFTGLIRGPYSVVARVWTGVADSVSIANVMASAVVDTLRLVSSATLDAFPNPFSTSMAIQFSLAANSPVEMRARKPSGSSVRTLVQQPLPAGVHRILWDGADDASNSLPPGPYWILFEAGADERAILVVKS